MTNILEAILNISNSPIYELRKFYQSKNRANNMGEALEQYIKDVFANTINENDELKRINIISTMFSYLGNQNNPPDMIIKSGDAIEVKKIESKNSGLALNSSYPKAKLFSNSPMLTQACKQCEDWKEKDILYVVGVVNDSLLKSLCFVYGVDYAATAEIYERIKSAISSGILTIPDIEFADTKELGRVNRVDPLGITYLRIRGMWHIENPMKTFNYVYQEDKDCKFNFMAIINYEKYNSFEENMRLKFEEAIDTITGLYMVDVKIKDPNNPAILKNAKLIKYSI